MKYCPKCGTQLEDTVKFCSRCGTNIQNEILNLEKASIESSSCSRLLAGLLNVFLPFGIGRFYAKYNKIGALQLVTSIFAIGIFWSFFDGIMILCTKDYPDGDGKPMIILKR